MVGNFDGITKLPKLEYYIPVTLTGIYNGKAKEKELEGCIPLVLKQEIITEIPTEVDTVL